MALPFISQTRKSPVVSFRHSTSALPSPSKSERTAAAEPEAGGTRRTRAATPRAASLPLMGPLTLLAVGWVAREAGSITPRALRGAQFLLRADTSGATCRTVTGLGGPRKKLED